MRFGVRYQGHIIFINSCQHKIWADADGHRSENSTQAFALLMMLRNDKLHHEICVANYYHVNANPRIEAANMIVVLPCKSGERNQAGIRFDHEKFGDRR